LSRQVGFPESISESSRLHQKSFSDLLPDYASPRYFASGCLRDRATTTAPHRHHQPKTWECHQSSVSLTSAGRAFLLECERRQAFPCTASHGQLVCPLSGLTLSRPAKDGGPIAQFVHVPAGDCRVEVSAAGYKPAVEHTESSSISDQSRSIRLCVFASGVGTRHWGTLPRFVPDKALKEIDKEIPRRQAYFAIQRKCQSSNVRLAAPLRLSLRAAFVLVLHRRDPLSISFKALSGTTAERAPVPSSDSGCKYT